MCKFFSFVGDGYGNYLFSDWGTRKRLIDNKSSDSPDSHTWILTDNKVPPALQDKWSKYEYNPLTKEFTIDEGREGHDHESAEAWVNSINFTSIVPALVTKKIKNPLTTARKVTDVEIQILKEWDSVRASVRASVGDSVRASVGDSVRDSVGASVWDSVGASVGDSVRASVGDSVWASVRASVGDSVWAYMSSFVDHEYKFDFTSCTKLYERGFVPSFDGTTWRLHTGKKAKIVYEITAEELRKI